MTTPRKLTIAAVILLVCGVALVVRKPIPDRRIERALQQSPEKEFTAPLGKQ